MARLPKNTLLRIHRLQRDQRLGVAFVLCGYCSSTLDNYAAMFRRAKRAFPGLQQWHCECGKVKSSSSVCGYTVLRFHITIPDVVPDGWELKDGKPEFELA